MADPRHNLPDNSANQATLKSALSTKESRKQRRSSAAGLHRRISFAGLIPEEPTDPMLEAEIARAVRDLEVSSEDIDKLEDEFTQLAKDDEQIQHDIEALIAEFETPLMPEQEAAIAASQASSAASRSARINQDDDLDDFQVMNSEPQESDRLLPAEYVRPGFLSKLRTTLLELGKNTGKSALSGAQWVKKHPFIFLIAILTATPNAVFAFTSRPEKLRELLASMSKSQIAIALTKALSSLGINAILNAYFLTTAWKKIRPIISHMLDGPVEFIEGSSVFVLAIAAALAAAALAYNSFYMIAAFAAAPATVSFSVNFASRLVGVKNAFTRIRNLTSNDAKVQLALADKLQHVDVSNPEYKKLFEDGFTEIKATLFANRNPDEPLSDSDFEKVEIRLAELISDHNDTYQAFLRATTNKELAIKYTTLSLQIFFCAAVLLFGAMPYALTYLEKGRDGIHILMQLMGKIFGVNWGLDNLPKIAQLAIGAPSGLATFMLAGGALLDTPSTTVKIAKHLYANPSDIVKGLGVLAANIPAAYAPLNTATSVVDNPGNKIGVTPGLAGSLFILANTLTGFDINARYTGEKVLLDPDITVADLKYENILERLEDPVAHRICEATTRAILTTALFAGTRPLPTSEDHEGNHDLNRIQSAPGM